MVLDKGVMKKTMPQNLAERTRYIFMVAWVWEDEKMWVEQGQMALMWSGGELRRKLDKCWHCFAVH